jgi:D-alanyl-D-alanine carboxypeptidase
MNAGGMRSCLFMSDRIVTLRRPAQGFARALAVAAVISGAGFLLVGNAEAAPNAAIVVDAKSGKVLYSSNADAKRHPASLTKIMTLYMLFESIDSGRNGLYTSITMSAHCAAQAPSKLGLKPGQSIKARDAILALVTKSANDVACAVGEHLVGGSELTFAKKMTDRAHKLGMTKTNFRNASGLPDNAQVTTARDMATLGRAIQDHFPEHYKFFATRSFKYGKNTYANHNRLLGRVDGVDGIKTGYTRASGFNLVSSVKRGNREVVAVVLGGDTGKARDARMASLISDYLPKATKGQRTAAIMPGAPVTLVAAIPIPPKRPVAGNDPIVTASVVGANSIFALAAVEQGDASSSEDIEIETPATRAIEDVLSETEAAEAEVEVAEAEAEPEFETAAVITSGWKIQLAATPTQSSAMEILDRARQQAPQVLANASPYTETVVKEDVTLHRARFAGFVGKDEARAACAELSKHDFACLALSN